MLAGVESEQVARMAIWGGIALGAIVIMVVALLWVRRSLFSGQATDSDGASWDLQTLQTMRDRGELTDAEYRSLRATVLESLTAGLNSEPPR